MRDVLKNLRKGQWSSHWTCWRCWFWKPESYKIWTIPSPKLTKTPLKMGRAPKGNNRIPTIHFQVRTVSFREGIFDTNWVVLKSWTHTVKCRYVFDEMIGKFSMWRNKSEFTAYDLNELIHKNWLRDGWKTKGISEYLWCQIYYI